MRGWLLGIGLAAAPGTARGQGAEERWTTLQTEHFRLHHPQVAAAWAGQVAGRLEELRARVAAEVGGAPDEIVDIVLIDPARQPNGFALPMTSAPRMAIFPTAPTAGGGLAEYRSWAEDLVVHEDAHLVHLMMPSRNPLWRHSFSLLGLEPNLGHPGWMIEGYATLIEGRLTGAGRPHGDGRAAWLGILAQDGRLPAYGELNRGAGFQARSHRYLLGSAYLEWLERRSCPGMGEVPPPGGCAALPSLLRRSTARQLRGFDEAFRGVFGEAPSPLYDRFRAELTQEALRVEALLPPDDSLWLALKGGTRELILSPDGQRLAVMRTARGRSSLQVFTTADPPGPSERDRLRDERRQGRDPLDVPAVPPRTTARQPVARRDDPRRPAAHPAWLPDGRLLITVFEPDRRGQLRPRLYAWDPEHRREQRISETWDLSQGAPHPDGRRILALRRSWGEEAILLLDPLQGTETALATFPAGIVLDAPRISPDGRTLAYLRHEGSWRLVLRELATGREHLPPLPDGALPSDPRFSPDGRYLLLALARDGRQEIHRLDLAWETWERLTQSAGKASAPALSPDGVWLYHLSLDSDGVDIHRLSPQAREATTVRPAPPLGPPAHPAPPPEPSLRPESVAARPYGFGRSEAMPLLGAGASAAGVWLEPGLRLGDLLNRHELIVMGGIGAVQGARARFTWRGPPLGVGQSLGLDLASRRSPGLDERSGAALGWDQGLQLAGASLELGLSANVQESAERATAALLGELRATQRIGGEAWLEPGAGLRLRFGSAPQRVQEANASLRVGAGEAWAEAGLEAGVAADSAWLGGMDDGLWPERLHGNWKPVPWLVDQPIETSRWVRQRAALGLHGLHLGHERWVLDGGPRSAWILGLALELPSQALVRLPALNLDMGLACPVEGGLGEGLAGCARLPGWTGWAGIGWGPR